MSAPSIERQILHLLSCILDDCGTWIQAYDGLWESGTYPTLKVCGDGSTLVVKTSKHALTKALNLLEQEKGWLHLDTFFLGVTEDVVIFIADWEWAVLPRTQNLNHNIKEYLEQHR